MMKTLEALRHGKISLVKTVWLYGTVIQVIIFHISRLIAHIFPFLFIINFIYMFFIGVCVWNSANNYHGPEIWKYLAKLGAIAGYIISIINIVFYSLKYL